MSASLLALVASVTGIAAIVAGGLLGLQLGTMRTLRETNQDLRDRVGDLEHDRTEDRAKIARLEADNAALGRIVTGEAHWVALGHSLDQHHQEAATHWEAVVERLDQINDKLTTRGGG